MPDDHTFHIETPDGQVTVQARRVSVKNGVLYIWRKAEPVDELVLAMAHEHWVTVQRDDVELK